MSVTPAPEAGAASLVSLSGEIDLTTAPSLHAALVEAQGPGSGPVVVDLTGVSFIDSSGLHALLTGLQRLSEAQRRMPLVVRKDSQVSRVLALTQMNETFAVHERLASALEEGSVTALD